MLDHAKGHWSQTLQQIYNRMAEKENDRGGAIVMVRVFLSWCISSYDMFSVSYSSPCTSLSLLPVLLC